MDFKEIFNNRPRCQHVDDDGKRCKADPQKDKKFCFMHDPGQKEKQAEARKKGGESRSRPYEVKIPAGFDPGSLESLPELRQFIAQAVRFMLAGEMDQRSARSCIYAANSIVAVLKEEARQQYRAHIVADKESRRLRRESDPWSRHFRASEKAAKAKEEAAQAEAKLTAGNEDNKQEVQQSLVADAAAQSMRELEKLKKEERKKEEKKEKARKQAPSKHENPDDQDESASPGREVFEGSEQQEESASALAQPPKPVRDYLMYGNSSFPPFEAADTNHHAELTLYMRAVHEYADLRPRHPVSPVAFAFKGARRRSRF